MHNSCRKGDMKGIQIDERQIYSKDFKIVEGCLEGVLTHSCGCY